MSTTSPISKNSSLDQLKEEYDQKRQACNNYARANFIYDLSDADSTYIKLLIERSEAELLYRKATGETIHIPRINKQLNHYKNLLQSRTGVII